MNEIEKFMQFEKTDNKEKCSNCKNKTNIKLKHYDIYSCSSLCLSELWEKKQKGVI